MRGAVGLGNVLREFGLFELLKRQIFSLFGVRHTEGSFCLCKVLAGGEPAVRGTGENLSFLKLPVRLFSVFQRTRIIAGAHP